MEHCHLEAMHDEEEKRSAQASSTNQSPAEESRAAPRRPIVIRIKPPAPPKDVDELEPPKDSGAYYMSCNGELAEDGATCEQCGKSFTSLKALYGHMRLHAGKASSQSYDSSLKWGTTGTRGRRSKAEMGAIRVLMEYRAMKRKAEIRLQLDEGPEGKRIKTDAPEEAHACHNKETAKPQDEEAATAANGAAARKAEDREHRCKVCGAVYPTGQSLGGHMRAHYDPDKRKRAGGRSPSETITAKVDDVAIKLAKVTVEEDDNHAEQPALQSADASPERTVEFLGQTTWSAGAKRPPLDFDLNKMYEEPEEMCGLSL